MRILTWNILFRERQDRLHTLAEHIRRIDPDVILLQESSPEHAQELASMLGHDLAIAADDPAADVVSCPAIITRLPFTDAREHLLEATPERHYWMVEVMIGGVRVASTHLQHTHEAGTMALDADYRGVDKREKVESIGEIEIRTSVTTRLSQLDIIREVVTDGTPTVCGGDFNFPPDGIEYRTIIEWGLVDAWRAGPRLSNRNTILQFNPLVSGGAHAYSRRAEQQLPGSTGPLDYNLDYVFTTPGLRIEDSWTVGRPFHDGAWPSDHLGVVADVH
ncbi:endonuclease/exonuclease/phosphatase family protein [Corynebacterium sp.]|uniref:endonuclease/exonuclease/phosphatase family protein n=1 Tax=Corynebacterium sp. TaxID=1720 RepID=UPI0026DF7273|nr:endonuclease/exonuclease/phosphatase family protein [Corynebacterium sp.]MDO5512861.1 endonuclease/exonuclease/phosphatase family protein [Corynebacterium sp.]